MKFNETSGSLFGGVFFSMFTESETAVRLTGFKSGDGVNDVDDVTYIIQDEPEWHEF